MRVLEQLRALLHVNRKAKFKLKKIQEDSRRNLKTHVDELMKHDMIRDLILEGAAWSKDRKPDSDDSCFWDYAKVGCAWNRYCEYRYEIGDIHLSQSCRLRDKPLPHDYDQDKIDDDDMTLKFEKTEIISHRYVYHNDDFERVRKIFDMEPWIFVTLVCVCVSIFFLLSGYLFFKIFHLEILKILKRQSRKLLSSSKEENEKEEKIAKDKSLKKNNLVEEEEEEEKKQEEGSKNDEEIKKDEETKSNDQETKNDKETKEK